MALAIGLAAAWSPAQWLLQAQGTPRLNDVTTDTANAPKMVVTDQMRRGSPNPAAYPGEPAAALQRAAYPDIAPLVIKASPAETFRQVDQVAMDMGLLEFPALFCARLSTFTPELQGQGLDRAIEMFRYRTREFDAAQSQVLFDAAASALAAGTLELEPTKKLTRLMASVACLDSSGGQRRSPA